MKRSKLFCGVFPALILMGMSGAHAWAGTIEITGTRYEAVPAAALGGRCDPVPTLTINNTVGVATGTSNFGNFVPDMTACLHTPFPAAITDGVFVWTFADGDTLIGTWSGLDTRITIPTGHLLTINETYLVTGGSGAFLDATGSIDESGSANSTGGFSYRKLHLQRNLDWTESNRHAGAWIAISCECRPAGFGCDVSAQMGKSGRGL